MQTASVDCVVIGAGVVGLACARALALAGREVIVLEAANAVGKGISSRNSEVIHAGIYYPAGSLKAKFCVRGKALLYQYCEERGIAFKRCGKLIVATEESQLPRLEALRRKGHDNGVLDLAVLSQTEALAKEKALHCVAALYSPSTGIIDSHGYMLALQGDVENAGGQFAFNTPVLGGEKKNSRCRLRVGGEHEMLLTANWVINCAGLESFNIARRITGIDLSTLPACYLAKGNYFALTGPAPFSHLIYPVPEQAGLGVHFSVDLSGNARFGPDVEWIDEVNYDVSEHRGQRFYEEIRKYWPALPDDSLHPGYAGIRPKITAPGEVAKDFLVQDSGAHSVPGLINLFGIESPGLTSSLAIAEHVNHLVQQAGE